MELSQLQKNGIVTTLYPWETELAQRVGKARDEQNRNKRNRMSYDSSRLMADNALANVHSVIAEIGACRIIGAYCYCAIWSARDHNQYRELLPDGIWGTVEIEVKWRRTGMSMPVDLKDAERNRLVLWAEIRMAECDCEQCASSAETRVRLLGGGYAGDLWPLGRSYNGDSNRVGVLASAITPISVLIRSK